MDSIDGQANHAREASDLPAGTGLTISIDRRGGIVVLAVRGSIDVLTAPQLSDAVNDAMTATPTALIIDISAVDFLSSAGMTTLVTAHENIAPTGVLAVVADGPATSRPMHLVGLDKTIAVYPTVDDAVARLGEERRTDPSSA
ncbi:STAS domain-containing protein [Williamsia sp.]|uniref:STAS domain-containing protein n=1 Tax=Williamsia sp. TaxID=1872085 RepID=UPI002F9433B0